MVNSMSKRIKLTLDEYNKSPNGKSGNTIGSQYLAAAYKEKYTKVMLRNNGHIDHNFLVDNGNYFILLRVPSEIVSKFTYEVVFKFSPSSASDAHASNLKSYNVTFFSNDPAFVFTYAHVYNNAGLIVEELIDRLPDEVIKTKPVERNPSMVINYAKILYFGYLYIKQHGFLDKHYYEESNLAIKDSGSFFKLITDSSTKLQERYEAEKDARSNDLLFKHRLDKRGVKSGGNANKVVKNIRKVKTVNTTTKTRPTIGKVKTTKTTKRK